MIIHLLSFIKNCNNGIPIYLILAIQNLISSLHTTNMNKIPFLVLFLLPCLSLAQSKKDLQSEIDSLEAKNMQIMLRLNTSEERQKSLENELKNIQITLTNTTTTMSLVTKTNLDLEAQVKSQALLVQKLMAQNDSLLRAFTANGAEEKFVTNPKNETDSIIYVIQNYYKAKKWEDRLQYVINADKVKPLMADAYKDEFKSRAYEKANINVPGSGYQKGKTFKVFINSEPIYLIKTENGFKLDWEATHGYNEKTIAAFDSEKSGNVHILRTRIGLGRSCSYEYYGFNKGSHICFIGDFTGEAFMSLSNPQATELKKLLEDGKWHQVIVEMQYKTFNTEYESRQFPFVTKFIKAGWDQ